MSGGRIVASVPAEAVDHLLELVLAEHLLELVLAEQRHLDGVERRWPAPDTFPIARDRAIARLQDQADEGDDRSVRTLAALIQASFDVEFVTIAGHLEGGQPEGPTL